MSEKKAEKVAEEVTEKAPAEPTTEAEAPEPQPQPKAKAKKKGGPKGLDPELKAMQEVVTVLDDLSPEVQARVICWAANRVGLEGQLYYRNQPQCRHPGYGLLDGQQNGQGAAPAAEAS